MSMSLLLRHAPISQLTTGDPGGVDGNLSSVFPPKRICQRFSHPISCYNHAPLRYLMREVADVL
ncbi:hypothetical protein EKD04_024780 [Chloroflexales bacterium ZM16-3]|nr:hypothetical protein [Chloroflexales bacterium ZM16-3]